MVFNVDGDPGEVEQGADGGAGERKSVSLACRTSRPTVLSRTNRSRLGLAA